MRTCVMALLAIGWATAAMAQYTVQLPPPPAQKTITILTSDLYYAPWDYDDVMDAITQYSLGSAFIDLRALVMDQPSDGWNGGLTSRGDGRTWRGIFELASGADVPYYTGLRNGLSSLTDTGGSQAANYRAGRDVILAQMAAAPDHSVVLHAVGSPRDIAAAYNQDPTLFARKVKRIYLSGGKEGAIGAGDANWGSDATATQRLLASGLPLYVGLISSDDSRHDNTSWSLSVPDLMRVTDAVNPRLSHIIHWSYYGCMDGGYRMKHNIAFPNRPALPAGISPPFGWAGNNTMASPAAFFQEPTIPAIDTELRGAGPRGNITRAMWSTINLIDAAGLKIFKNSADPTQIKLSYNDVEPLWQRVAYFQPVISTVAGNSWTYAPSGEAAANMHVFTWETANRAEYGAILDAVYRQLVQTYLPPPHPATPTTTGS